MTRYPDRTYFARRARETGFRAAPLETVFRLSDLLQVIVDAVGEEVCLRGGTALNLVHLNMPRLSVDADLDYIGSANPDEARRRRPGLLGQVRQLGELRGYRVVEERASYAMTHLRMHYENAEGRSAQMKVDLNFLDRVPVLPPESRVLQHPFSQDLATPELQTVQLAELCAGKLIALLRRSIARDLFDAAMLAGIEGLDVDTARMVLVVRGASYPPPPPSEYRPNVVEKITNAAWRSEVMAFARRPLPVTLDEARDRARGLLERLSDLDDGHRGFLQAIENGEIRPELLSVSQEIHDRIKANPGLLWRLRVGARGLEDR